MLGTSRISASDPTTWFCGTVIVYCCLGAHFLMRHNAGGGLNLPLNIVTWLFVSLLVGIALWQIAHARCIVLSKMSLYGIAGVACLVVPWIYPNGLSLQFAAPRLLAVLAGLIFYIALLQFKFSSRALNMGLMLILVCCAIEISLGLVQYLLLSEGNWIGYNVASNRPYGVFYQPNLMASLVCTGLAVSFFLFVQSSADQRTAKNALLHAFVTIFGAMIVFVLGSRAGYLGLVAAILLLTPYAYQRSVKATFIWLSGLSLGVFLGWVTLSNAGEIDSIVRTNVAPRMVIYKQALLLIQNNPLFGVGYGGFHASWQSLYMSDPDRIAAMQCNLRNLEHPHNEVLYWTVEGGVVALMGLLVIVAGIAGLVRRFSWPLGLAMLGLLVPIALHTQTELPFYQSSVHFVVFLGLLFYVDTKTGTFFEHRLSSVSLPRALAWLVPMIAVPFMLTGLHTQYLLTRFEASLATEIHRLDDIINPVIALDRLQRNRRGLQFLSAMKSNDQEALADYISWADKSALYEPRLYLYVNRAQALIQLEQPTAAAALLSEAERRFGGGAATATVAGGTVTHCQNYIWLINES